MPTAPATRVLDATPWYSVVPAAVERMSDVLTQPRTRAILLLRDPVDRAYSMYWDQVAAGRERRPVADALLDPASDTPPKDQTDARKAYIWGSRYELHVPRFEAAIGPRRILLLSMEDLATPHLESTWLRLLEFLGLPEAAPPSPAIKNQATHGPTSTITALWHSKAILPLRRVARWLPHEIRLSLGTWIAGLNPGANAAYPQLDDSLRHELCLRLDAAATRHRSVLPVHD